MKSILTDLPDGSEVVMRTVRTLAVEIVYGHDDLYFSAVEPGGERSGDGCEFYDRAMIADFDMPLVRRGAWFWLVAETVRSRHGHMEVTSAIAFQHPGVASAEEAFAARHGGTAPGVGGAGGDA